jgi:hypothetical protein
VTVGLAAVFAMTNGWEEVASVLLLFAAGQEMLQSLITCRYLTYTVQIPAFVWPALIYC